MDQVIDVGKQIWNCLPIGLLYQHFCYVVSCTPFFDSLAGEMSELTSRRGDMQRKVDTAVREGKEPTERAKWWLDAAGVLETETQLITAEFNSRPPLREDCKKHIWLSYTLNKRADELLQEVSNLKGEACKITEVADESRPVKFIYMEPVPNAVGMESALKQLLVLVNDDDAGIIGIHGMAGVGKTALLRTFHNEHLAGATDFNMLIWVDVTKDVDVDVIQETIRDRLKLSWQTKKLHTERAAILRSALRNMKFVVFLDDIWRPLYPRDLHAIGIPSPERKKKQKIILTTRKENVCGRMGATATTTVKTECLTWKDSWRLFTAVAGGEDCITNSDVQHHAKKLVEQCGGLPLALAHVGGGMIGKTSPEEWRLAVSLLREITPWELSGMADRVLDPLELSYNDLSNNKMRTFLLYCSLFPNSHWVRKEHIIQYGIGEGILDVQSRSVELDTGIYEEGHDLIGNIKAASLIEYYDKDIDHDCIDMHPMVRAMVTWVSCDHGTNPRKWLVAADLGLREAFPAEYWEDAKWISLMSNEIQELPESPNCQALEVLLLQENKNLKIIPRSFFMRMPVLRVLNLSKTAIEEFPAGIEALVSLRYLDLSYTKIASLPAGLKALSQLRVLLLSYTLRLQSIPEGVIRSLSQLRVLDMYVSGAGVNLEELKCLKRLKSIGITVSTLNCLERISQSSRLVRSLRDLDVTLWTSSSSIQLPFDLPGAKDMIGLRWLRISNSAHLKEVIIGSNGSGVVVSQQRSLSNLRELVFENLPDAKFIWKGRALQNLRYLCFFDCKSMEQLINEEEGLSHGGFISFPNLRVIWLHRLPELRTLSARSTASDFPSLQELQVLDCPKLNKLGLDGAEKMKVICGQKAWWDALEWDDGSLARSSHLFKAYSE